MAGERFTLTRDQVVAIVGDNQQRIKAFEALLSSIPGDPVTPIDSPLGSDTSYTVPNIVGRKTILIEASDLVASLGGPFILTITTGTGSVVRVPIAAAGQSILSGDLLFDIWIDAAGNVTSSGWSIRILGGTSNAQLDSTGWKVERISLALGAATQAWTFARDFASPPEVITVMEVGAAEFATFDNLTVSGVDTLGWDAAGAPSTGPRSAVAIGPWW